MVERIARFVLGLLALAGAFALVPPPTAPRANIMSFLVLYGFAVLCIDKALWKPRAAPPETP